jgi:hypothetical protein
MEKVTEKLRNLNIDPKNIKGEYSIKIWQNRLISGELIVDLYVWVNNTVTKTGSAYFTFTVPILHLSSEGLGSSIHLCWISAHITALYCVPKFIHVA